MSNKTKIEVSRGSQFQNDPQLNLAQRAPVIVARMQNINPRPAAASDLVSSSRSRFRKYWIPNHIDVKNATTVVHAVGTWKMIFRAFSSSPGITGNSNHPCGEGDSGMAMPPTRA